MGTQEVDFVKATQGVLTGTLLRRLNFERGSSYFQILTCYLGKERFCFNPIKTEKNGKMNTHVVFI